MRHPVQVCSCALALLAAAATAAAQGPPAEPAGQRLEAIQRQEGEAVIALADAAMAGKPGPADFPLHWHNDFFRATEGTFVPFVISIEAPDLTTPALLIYVRAASRTPPADLTRAVFPFEDAYPVASGIAPAGRVRLTRGFTVAPGEYDLILVARERVDPAEPERPRRAAVRRVPLVVPDLWVPGMTTSSVILADRQRPLAGPVSPEELPERPYALGLSEIEPSLERRFRRDDEMVVVFLVYNASVDERKQFDVEVEYHFLSEAGSAVGGGGEGAPAAVRDLARPGERYFNRTKPQRFNPGIMGPRFDPSAGQPIMAGQGVPLSGFPEGNYRLVIRITDIITGRTITRDASFAVTGAGASRACGDRATRARELETTSSGKRGTHARP